ncbi:hypothetical protein LCGC14_3099350, partial [marine sediment metagenome]
IPESMIGGGLISRILFVYADKKRHLAPYLDEVMPEAEFASVKEKLIEDLCAVAKIKGAYELAPDARVWGRDWYKSLWGDRPVHMASQRFDAYISRKQTHVHKLAMVMAAAQRDELVITLDDLTTAARFVTSLEDAMIHVFESIGVVDTAKTVMEMMNIVKVHGKIDQRALWDRCIRIMSLKGFQEATDAAVRAGDVCQQELDAHRKRGHAFVVSEAAAQRLHRARVEVPEQHVVGVRERVRRELPPRLDVGDAESTELLLVDGRRHLERLHRAGVLRVFVVALPLLHREKQVCVRQVSLLRVFALPRLRIAGVARRHHAAFARNRLEVRRRAHAQHHRVRVLLAAA